MHRSLCICGLLPRLVTRTRVVLVIHQLETVKPTNTGVIAARCLANSAVVYRGRAPDDSVSIASVDQELVREGMTSLFLFPHADATPLESWRGRDEQIQLVVPDATWSQAARMRGRMARGLPCVSLPARGVGADRLRAAVCAAYPAVVMALACLAFLPMLVTNYHIDLYRSFIPLSALLFLVTAIHSGSLLRVSREREHRDCRNAKHRNRFAHDHRS